MKDSLLLYRRLLGCLRPYWRVVLLALAAMLVTAAMEPALPALMKPLVDESLIAKNDQAMLWVPLGLLAVFTVKGLAEYLASVASQWIAQRAIADLRAQMFARLLDMPLHRQRELGSSALLSRITFDVTQVGSALSQAWVVLVRDSLVVLALLAYLLWSSWQLTLFILVIAPAVAWIIRKASGLMRGSSKAVQETMARLTTLVDEALANRRDISIYAGQPQESRRFADTIEALRARSMEVVKVSSANVPLVQVLAAVAVVGVLIMATQLNARNLLTPGDLVAFLTAMSLLFEPIRRLTRVNEQIQRGLAAAASVFALIDEAGEADPGQERLPGYRGALRLENLHYRYPGQDSEALAAIDLEIPAGSTVALVGPSGGGKSTLADLLCRFIEPTQGRILADGTPLAALSLAHWRTQVALVSQSIVLFDDSIAANIAYGDPGADPARIEAAARAAHAWSFIAALPDGLATRVGEGGSRLSGGQRQRLALARAFYKDVPVLILDEATSALDAESEAAIGQALAGLRGRRTVLIVAHRLSTVRHADRIVVLEAGRCLETGSHDQLLARAGRYAALVAANGRESRP